MVQAYGYFILKLVKGLVAQTTTLSMCLQDADRDATNVTWMIIAIVFLVVAVLLAITSIALGTMLCCTRK